MPRRPTLKKLLDPTRLEQSGEELTAYLKEGGTIQELLRLSPQILEHLYASGYRLLQNSNYESAQKTFALLTLFAPGVKEYWMALGASQVASEEYQSALHSYEALSCLDDSDHRPHSFAAYCHFQLKEEKEGRRELREAHKRRR